MYFIQYILQTESMHRIYNYLGCMFDSSYNSFIDISNSYRFYRLVSYLFQSLISNNIDNNHCHQRISKLYGIGLYQSYPTLNIN